MSPRHSEKRATEELRQQMDALTVRSMQMNGGIHRFEFDDAQNRDSGEALESYVVAKMLWYVLSLFNHLL